MTKLFHKYSYEFFASSFSVPAGMPVTPTRVQPPRSAMKKAEMNQVPSEQQISDNNNIERDQSITSQFQIM